MRLEEAFSFEILEEGISPVVFHATDFPSFLNMVKKNRIMLSPALTRHAEMNFGDSFYFLSTARTRVSGYFTVRHNVIIRLDGKKLAQRYSGSPVDYFKHRSKYDRSVNFPDEIESEDRVYSDKPHIDNFLSYVTGVDIAHDDDYDFYHYFTLYMLLTRANIPVRIYESFRDFKTGTNNFMSKSDIKDMMNKTKDLRWREYGDDTERHNQKEKDAMLAIITVLKDESFRRLREPGKSMLENASESNFEADRTRFYQDTIEFGGNSFKQELSRLMRMKGLRNIDDLGDHIKHIYLKEKWNM